MNPGKAKLFAGLLVALPALCWGEVISRLPTQEKQVALTFDACESRTPAFLDRKIVEILLAERLPCTLFISGRFAVRNRRELERLAAYDFIEIENHSLNHRQHMEKLSPEDIQREVLENEKLLQEITGKKTVFFRFPAGNYDRAALQTVESLGYRVVHWSFASGDPSPAATARRLENWVVGQTKPAAILIFHINGRGWATAEALPHILSTLRQRGYRFVKLKEALSAE